MSYTIKNPIIPGFYPDPTIIRVGEDFYLATSSFEQCPGIPVFHSKDLAHWEQICYAMTMENGLHEVADMLCGGMMAPTLRYHDGIYYIVCCNFADRGNFYITAENPAGPWSKPNWITDIPDIDCSLFFDEDGKSYLVSPGDDKTEDNGRAFFLTPYDLKNNKACGERVKIWNSALRKAWAPEAPHIYHVGEYYYLMIAEGGTDHDHSVAIARSKTVDGFYEGYSCNPVLTHRHLGWDYPIQNIGHADLVDTPSGEWYAVMLGSRIIDGQHKNFGRETYICPVTWERGWPLFSPGTGRVEFEYPAPKGLPCTEYAGEPARDDFDNDKLALCWEFWGTPYQDFWRIADSKLYLKCLKRPFACQLKGFTPGVIDDRRDNCISYIARRQRHTSFTLTTKMTFEAKNDESAGFVIQQATNHQIRLEKINKAGKQYLRLVMLTTEQEGLPFLPGYKADTTETELALQEYEEDTVVIQFVANRLDYTFKFGPSEDKLQILAEHVDGALINPESVGGMVGTMLGMYASGNGTDSDNEAAFDYFEINEN